MKLAHWCELEGKLILKDISDNFKLIIVTKFGAQDFDVYYYDRKFSHDVWSGNWVDNFWSLNKAIEISNNLVIREGYRILTSAECNLL